MKHQALHGKTIAIVATDGFERAELYEPKKALEDRGATVQIVAPHEGTIRAMDHHEWADDVAVDLTTHEADPDEYDALVLPGGVMNPDHLRMDPAAVSLVRRFCDTGRPVAAICHGPWTLIEAGVVRGRTLTSYRSLRTDLTNAGASWVDRQVVVDRNLITSRRPDDLAAFCEALIVEIAAAPAPDTRRDQPRA